MTEPAPIADPRRTPTAEDAMFPALASPPALEAKARADWLLGAVLAFGLGLRVLHLFALRRSPFFDVLQLDAEAYDAWARAIAGGALLGERAFWVDPLYAYVLGGLYRVFGHDLVLPRVFNAACGVATAWLVSRTALRVWGSRVAQIAAALLCAWFVPALHFEGQPEKTTLSVLLIAASLELFTRGSTRALIGSGAVLGLAVLARGNSLVLLPVAVLALALGWDAAPELRTPLRQRVRRAAVFGAAALALISLAALHNWIAVRQFVPLTTSLGINLYLGNNAENRDGYYTPPAFLHPDARSEAPDFRAEARRRTGEELDDAALSGYWAREAFRAVLADPQLAFTRSLRKLQLALHDDELPDSDAIELVANWSPVLRSPLWWFGELLPLAMLGALVGFRRRAVRVVTVVALVYVLSLLPFFVMGRLRVQLLPACAVLAAGGVVWLLAALRARDARLLARGGAVLALVAAFAFYRPAWMAFHRETSLAVSWNNLGANWLARHESSEAIAAYERAVSIHDAAVPAALRALGVLYRERGDWERAEQALRRLVVLRPNSRSARDALLRLYREMLRAGMVDQAISGMQRAVRETTYDEGLHYVLGEAMEQHATPAAMIAFFAPEVARDQKPQTSHYFWARGLARSGDIAGAIEHLQQALAIDPAHELSQREWGALLERQGQLEPALSHFAEAARIHPEFRAALEDAARVAQQLDRPDEAEAFRARAARADPNTRRRYVYWARYLHEHGRDAAAAAEVQRMLDEVPGDAEALALRATLAASTSTTTPRSTSTITSDWRLDAQRRDRLVARLSQQPPGASTWITYDARDAEARALATEIGAAFETAHWRVRSVSPAEIALRPGVMLLAAAPEPSAACQNARAALEAIGLPLTFGSGYREFAAERRRENPNYQALSFADDQDFALVIGRRP